MCIIFLYVNNDESSDYKLIVAANRDEYLSRPAKPADFYPGFPDVLCGIDMESGVEGGTWLGVTKKGKFAAITNVMVDVVDSTKPARGRLVIDYLKGEKSPMEYLQALQNMEHREYNLLVGNIDPVGKTQAAFYSNCDGAEPRILSERTTVFSCTRLNGKWRKIQHGKLKFEEILSKLNSTPDPQILSNLLLDSLLSDTTPLYPDPEVKAQSKNRLTEEALQKYCSVKIAGLPGYGTRMQTVVLIDKNNVVHFTERTLDGGMSKKYYSFTIE